MAYIYILAIILGILSYSLLNIGMGLQKKAAAELPKIEKQSVRQNFRNFFTSKTWLIGFSMVQIQWIFLTLALDLAPISIVTPLMSFGMVALVIFSYFYLKEPISKIEIIGIVAIMIGIVALGLTNPNEEVNHDLSEICGFFNGIDSIIFLSIIFIITIGLILTSILRKYANADILFGIAAGITDALGAIFLKAYLGGVDFGNAITIQQSAIRWEWWLFFVFMLIFNGTATIYLQVAYQRGKAIIVAPIFAVFAMTTPVIAGIIIFDEWNIFAVEGTLWKIYVKVVALIVVIIGAIILSSHSARTEIKKNRELQTHLVSDLIIDKSSDENIKPF